MTRQILIVDDEVDFIELVKFRLADLKCDFLVANDGVQALSQARQFKPDLILLDILLPDLDGLSVCEILKRQPSTRKIPVIFMSALSSQVTKRTTAMQVAGGLATAKRKMQAWGGYLSRVQARIQRRMLILIFPRWS